MAQQGTKKEYTTFVAGLITEAGPLTFPENSSYAEENCVLNRDGSRQRRLGIDFETGFALRNVTIAPTDAVETFRWENAANDTDNQFALVQTGKTIWVFDANASSVSNNLIGSVTLSALDGTKSIQGESGSGYFFLCDGTTDPYYLAYNPTTNTITATQYQLKIRDFFGVDDGLAVDTRPATLSATHQYNLMNQGWSSAQWTPYFTTSSVYPANNQQWFVGKNTDDNFDAALLNKQDFGTTPAPKGRYIIDAFNRSASRNAITSLAVPTDTEGGRPSTVAFAFERVFYAGVDSTIVLPTKTQPNMTGYVFYSRTIGSSDDFGKCYSEADPTSEIDSELVDTDGGYINIPASGKIYKVMAKGSYVLVFADKGIWAITGDDSGFRGTSYQVVQISDAGVEGVGSIVEMEEGATYWNKGGIYAIGPSEAGGLSTQNITETTIQTLYNGISRKAKRTAKGNYDPINRRMSWIYNTEESYDGVNYKNKYDTELVFDRTLGAFYLNKISKLADPSPYVAGFIILPNFVPQDAGVRSRGNTVTKYLVVQYVSGNNALITFGDYHDEDFRDWRSMDGIGSNFVSFLETGWEIMGDTTRNKQAPYIICHFEQTERKVVDVGGVLQPDNPSSCLLQSKWDWSDNAISGKWGAKQQVYALSRPIVLGNAGADIVYGSKVVTTKRRLPGRGKALSLRFESEAGKDFLLYGWAIKFVGNSNV